MTAIHVCSLARLHDTVRASAASHVVSLVSQGTDLERPPDIAAGNHLDLRISDITEAMEGEILAEPQHVQAIVDFVVGWNGDRPMVVHCYAGISRSTAAAFIALCVIQPGPEEARHASVLRQASSTATPNRHLVALADQLLARDGRMVAAIDAIGRGMVAFEGTPFALAVGR